MAVTRSDRSTRGVGPASEWRVRLAVVANLRVISYALLLSTTTPAAPRVLAASHLEARARWLGRTLIARVDRGFFRRAVIEADDGSLIRPAGRLRRNPPLTFFAWPRSWPSRRPPAGGLVWVLLLVADIGIGHGEPAVPVRYLEFPAFVVYGCWSSL